MTSSRGFRVAVVGATGVVGQEMLKVLHQRSFPVASLRALASERSNGQRVAFNGGHVDVETLGPDSFRDIDIALFSAGAAISWEFAPIAVEAGALVIDNSSQWRMAENCPLVVPEVNGDDISDNEGIIANPNCCAIPLTMVADPIRRAAGIERMVVATYQSASGAGKPLVEELDRQTRAIAAGQAPIAEVYPTQLAHNVVPGGWTIEAEGYYEEEVKIVNESRKILHDPELRIAVTCVRVPVPIGHGEAVFIETRTAISPDEVRALLGRSSGVTVEDDPAAQIYPTPASAAGQDDVFVGRLRLVHSVANGV
ncbi:MAG: aspartate-semialdehyde dehydrogenase [Candidatus Dormibacteraeota bacterium]|nr:aspartate-semialdehyde dehydrogenase [Candidatus Dormibacteraeota bacterium]